MNIKHIREIFEVNKSYVFLNNAAESPMNNIFKERIDNFFDMAMKAPHTKPDVRDDVRDRLSILLGGQSEDYALITSTGIGSGIVAAGMDFKAGDNVVIPDMEHRNNLFPWLALKEKGVEIRYVPVAENGDISLEDIEAAVNDNTRIVTIAAVRFNSGLRVDLKSIAKIAHKHNALFFVDAIQAAGIVPIDVEAMDIDIMSAAGFKWLLGIPGTGFLYVSKAARNVIKPIIPGMFAAENSITNLVYHKDSRKYETGSITYSAFYAWVGALDFLIDLGIDAIYERVIKITDLLIDGFKKRQINIVSPIEVVEKRSSILFFTLESEERNVQLVDALIEKNIIMCVRDGKCRISPSFFTTEEEIKTFFEVLDTLMA